MIGKRYVEVLTRLWGECFRAANFLVDLAVGGGMILTNADESAQEPSSKRQLLLYYAAPTGRHRSRGVL